VIHIVSSSLMVDVMAVCDSGLRFDGGLPGMNIDWV
jgi:hypothetical protein